MPSSGKTTQEIVQKGLKERFSCKSRDPDDLWVTVGVQQVELVK